MSKFGRVALIAFAIAGAAQTPVSAGILGPDAGQCASGDGPAMLVRVTGLKNRAGTIRVRSFGGSPATWFDKRHALKRTVVDTPVSGSIDICMPVSGPGTYAVDVRHDINGNGKTDKADGAGASGNPEVSLLDVVFKRKPSPSVVAVRVGAGVTAVPVLMKYVQGGSLKPVQLSAR